MSCTLISFLGKGRVDKSTGYKQASYIFPDGRTVTTPFFGLALKQILQPQRLILLGTSGSMWGVLVEHLAVAGEDEELRLELLEASEKERVTAELLGRSGPLVERALGIPCTLRLIDYGRDQSEQIAILAEIAKAVKRERVTLDITHGFRHLAALGLLSAFFLEKVARLQVDGLFYGALDMTENGITPVVSLQGLLQVQRWIDALDRFDQDGDYSVFTPLLQADSVPDDKARCLTEAAFHERTFNLADARRKLQSFLPVLDAPLSGTSALFQPQLKERLAWAKTGTLFDHQRKLAYLYLERNDPVRGAIFGFEAMVTNECQHNGFALNDYEIGRKPAADALDAQIRAKRLGANFQESYWMLKNLRNALAHGTPPTQHEYRRILTDPTLLTAELRKALDCLLGQRGCSERRIGKLAGRNRC